VRMSRYLVMPDMEPGAAESLVRDGEEADKKRLYGRARRSSVPPPGAVSALTVPR
jgi:hypothetical protein